MQLKFFCEILLVLLIADFVALASYAGHQEYTGKCQYYDYQYRMNVEICCNNYRPKPQTNASVLACEPICVQPCKNGFCSAPGHCTCFQNYIKDDQGHCAPTCPLGQCSNGVCIYGRCICDPGFRLHQTGLFCVPDCRDCGPNAYCVRPNDCRCKDMYARNPILGTCDPICNQDCGLGSCQLPGVCECQPDTELIDGVCQKRCTRVCQHGLCVGYEHCKCLTGYRKNNQTDLCEPICNTVKCDPGVCIAPEQCFCPIKYMNTKTGCKPVCRNGCGNGKCIAPGVCDKPTKVVHSPTRRTTPRTTKHPNGDVHININIPPHQNPIPPSPPLIIHHIPPNQPAGQPPIIFYPAPPGPSNSYPPVFIPQKPSYPNQMPPRDTVNSTHVGAQNQHPTRHPTGWTSPQPERAPLPYPPGPWDFKPTTPRYPAPSAPELFDLPPHYPPPSAPELSGLPPRYPAPSAPELSDLNDAPIQRHPKPPSRNNGSAPISHPPQPKPKPNPTFHPKPKPTMQPRPEPPRPRPQPTHRPQPRPTHRSQPGPHRPLSKIDQGRIQDGWNEPNSLDPEKSAEWETQPQEELPEEMSARLKHSADNTENVPGKCGRRPKSSKCVFG